MEVTEALTWHGGVADSALRHGNVTRTRLLQLADRVRTTGRAQALRVAREANGRAADPFESVLRAISLDVPERRLVVEADSFEYHGGRRALVEDCARYNALTLRGWQLLRFSYEHVTNEPDYVHTCLGHALRWRPPRPAAHRPRRRRAG